MKSVVRELSLFLRFGEQIKNQCVHAPAVPFLGCKSSEHNTAALSVEKPGLWHLPASSTRRLDLWRMAVIVQMDREYWWLKVSEWLRIQKWSRKWLLPTERLQLNPWSITLEGIIIIAHRLMAALNYRCFSNIWYFSCHRGEVVKFIGSKKT